MENLKSLPLELLLVVESWGLGGTERYVDTLYEELSSSYSGLRIHLALLNDVEVPARLKKCSWLTSVSALGSCGARRFRGLRKLIIDLRPTVCHFHLYTSLLRAVLSCKYLGTRCPRLVATFHSPLSQWNLRHRVGFRIAVGFCDCVIGASEYTASELRRWRCIVIQASPPIKVGFGNSDSTVEARDITDTSLFRVTGCGRLSVEKNWTVVIESIARCRKISGFEVGFELIGDGPELASLQALAKESGISNQVIFAGSLSHKVAMLRVSKADLFVLPSRYEGFGMAAVEAMMLGVPIVVADFPASTEYIEDRVTGCRFRQGDSAELAELIRWHYENPTESKRMAQAGQKFAIENYAPKKIAKIHVDLYRSIMSLNGCRRSSR